MQHAFAPEVVVSASGMPDLAAVKIAAAPASRIGRLSRTQAVNSSSRWRRRERCCSNRRYPVRQVSIRNATTQASKRGNQPPASSFVALAPTKTSSGAFRSLADSARLVLLRGFPNLAKQMAMGQHLAGMHAR